MVAAYRFFARNQYKRLSTVDIAFQSSQRCERKARPHTSGTNRHVV